MLYPWLEWQSSLVSAWLDLSRLGAAGSPLEQLLHPSRELLVRTLAAVATSDRDLSQAVRVDASFPVLTETLAVSPFARVIRFTRPRPQRRRFLLLAPCSGYATAVISPLVAMLASAGKVVVTEWTDARLVPAAAGPFGLAQQIELGLAAARMLDGPAHLLALSQSGPAGLAVATLLARQEPGRTPASLAFLGCQLDPVRAPSALQQVLAPWPRDLLAAQLTSPVSAAYPGAGRWVYPAVLQLLAYSVASPQLYAEVQGGLLRELAAGEIGGYERLHADIHSLADVPAELFLDMLDWMRDDGAWTGRATEIAGVEVDLGLLRPLPLLTLESAEDELVGQGQTHALVERLRPKRVRSATLPRGRHHDLFTGPGFATRVAPLLRAFYGALDS